MPARNVSLTQHFDEFVELNVESGRFQNASEVVREGLRLLEQRQHEDAIKLEALRRAADQGLQDIAEGRVTVVEDGELDAYLDSLGR